MKSIAEPHQLPEHAEQLLPAEAYYSQAWFDREQQLLHGDNWALIGGIPQLKNPGDFLTLTVGESPIIAIRGQDNQLRAFHNICRHRGTVMEEGCGNVGASLVCPYHSWAYSLDGSLRGVPNQETCFPGLDKSNYSLLPAGLGVFRGMVFVHPRANACFDEFLADLPEQFAPHDISEYVAGSEIIFEMNCNWKVFYENAIDGYHLATLHSRTLGGPLPHKNQWDVAGRHLVWYSTEYQDKKSSMPKFVADQIEAAEKMGEYTNTRIPGAEDANFGGVVMLFPMSIIGPSPFAISTSQLIPVKPDMTLLKTTTWSPDGSVTARPSYKAGMEAAKKATDPKTGHIKLSLLDRHPLESKNFQIEDMWICEKVQRGLRSPAWKVDRLALGTGAESTITTFHKNVLDFVPLSSTS